MNGAEYIVEFLRQRKSTKFFLVTGGACAFIIDAIGRNKGVEYVCFQHEQGAAMAADTNWRINKTVGVTVATSGPGATNLITGIACSYFDSIPSIHITGQVNKSESAAFLGAKVRQAGFQETNIVDIAKPITKYAVQVNSIEELKKELINAYNIAIDGRMGPVLIDVPMNVQKEDAGTVVEYHKSNSQSNPTNEALLVSVEKQIQDFFSGAERPLILFGGGIGQAGVEKEVVDFIEKNKIPFVTSWSGITFFNHDSKLFFGHIGVYGNRGANFILQNCDALLVLGSRLDNRQRSGNSKSFAPNAKVLVIDIDEEEIKKYVPDGYKAVSLDLKQLPAILKKIKGATSNKLWFDYMDEMKAKYFDKDLSTFAKKHNTISPYGAVMKLNQLINKDAIVVSDCGANLCWVYQVFHRTEQNLFTAAGNSPMGYSLPAAIGAALNDPSKEIICLIGDGGFQMNIQELQTVKHYNLDIKIILLNNYGYGIIKQFQDAYFESRYYATGEGYSLPDFEKIANAYGISYKKINKLDELTKDLVKKPGSVIIDITLDENTLIEPKLEMGRPIHDQFPYISDEEFSSGNRFFKYTRMK